MPSLASTWFLIQSGPGPAAFNLALDEALLEAMPRLGKPVLRFYGWTDPAASFGYFQAYAEVGRATPLRPLIRRPTGGGLVPHDADWTYSLVVPPGHEWYSLRAEASYWRVHEWLQAAFAKLGVVTELASSTRKAGPGQCFSGHEKHDLLWRGRKVAGAAQRRNKLGLLIQGSVQPPPGVERSDWQRAMCDVAAGVWARWRHPPGRERRLAAGFSAAPHPRPGADRCSTRLPIPAAGEAAEWEVRWTEFDPDPALRERAAALARDKYAQPAYNRKR